MREVTEDLGGRRKGADLTQVIFNCSSKKKKRKMQKRKRQYFNGWKQPIPEEKLRQRTWRGFQWN